MNKPIELLEGLRSSAKAFRDNPVYNSEGDGAYLVTHAEELEAASDLLESLQSELSAMRERVEAAYREGARSMANWRKCEGAETVNDSLIGEMWCESEARTLLNERDGQ